jgi:hypothetical protein
MTVITSFSSYKSKACLIALLTLTIKLAVSLHVYQFNRETKTFAFSLDYRIFTLQICYIRVYKIHNPKFSIVASGMLKRSEYFLNLCFKVNPFFKVAHF